MSLPFVLREFHTQRFFVARLSETAREWPELASDFTNTNGVFDEPVFALSPSHEAQINPHRLLYSPVTDMHDKRI